MLLNKIRLRLFAKLLRLVQLPRIVKYRMLSNCKIVGKPFIRQPVQMMGKGEIKFNGHVTIGWFPSPHFFNGYAYIEARNCNAKVIIGHDSMLNNNFVAICDHTSIIIGEKVLIGPFVEIYDSNFHGLEPDRRYMSCPDEAAAVIIEDNVFIGSNVKILKGVTIGRDSVIANGSIVTKSIPPGVVAGGNPAKVLRNL